MTAFRVGAATDVGRVRSNNQDSKLVFDEEAVYAVADGMGGHQGGEVASAIAVETLEAIVSDATTESMVDAVKEANRRIISRATDTTELRGMGTTLVAVALVNRGTDEEEIAWVNVGDSRAYLLRDGELVQLSQDHSLVEDLRRGGQLSDEEAAVHPQRNILTRALGIDREVEVDSGAVMPFLGDRFLLCSDGLFNEVTRDGIVATLSSFDDPDAAAEELVRLANEGGGRDNITCVVVDVTDDGGRAVRAAALAAEAEARRQAAADEGTDDSIDEVDIDTVETSGRSTAATVGAAGVGAAGVAGAGVDEPAGTSTPAGVGGDDDVASDDDPTPPNGTPLPPPPTATDGDATTEPATVDPDEGGPSAGDATADDPTADEAAAAFIDPGFPTDGDETPAGSERFINPGFPTADAPAPDTDDDDLPFGGPDPTFSDPDAGNRSHLTKILAGIVVAIVLAAAIVGGITWYGGQGYFVAVEGERLAIYEGRPGGFLWVEPSRVEVTDVSLADATAADMRSEVFDEPTFSSRGAADAYIAGIEEAAATAEAEDEASTTTTEKPTTTTKPGETTGSSTSSGGTPGKSASTPATDTGP